MNWRVDQGDCVEVMAAMPEASVDAIVTDPPYGLGFMGKQWDSLPPGKEWAEACLHVLKPGGHLLAFGGTRTYHRLAVAIEDAGFEIRDTIAWMYGSGFPKSLDVAKALDKDAGHWRGKAGAVASDNGAMAGPNYERTPKGDPVTPAAAAAAAAAGWGTALKPAHEPIVVARKPLVGTVAQTFAQHGTGALNIDACRIDTGDEVISTPQSDPAARAGTVGQAHTFARLDRDDFNARQAAAVDRANDLGRWPANVVLDTEAGAMLDEQTGDLHVAGNKYLHPPVPGGTSQVPNIAPGPSSVYDDKGGASRFFYCAKADSGEREAGLAHLPTAGRSDDGYGSIQTPTLDRSTPRENWEPRERRNVHPTVKPIDLMRWLVRLVTPPGGTVLDPFTGSGTTGCATVLEAFDFIGIEREAEYVQIARARIDHWEPQGWQMELIA